MHYWSTDEGSTFASVEGALAYGCEVQYTADTDTADTDTAAADAGGDGDNGDGAQASAASGGGGGGSSECVIMVRREAFIVATRPEHSGPE